MDVESVIFPVLCALGLLMLLRARDTGYPKPPTFWARYIDAAVAAFGSGLLLHVCQRPIVHFDLNATTWGWLDTSVGYASVALTVFLALSLVCAQLTRHAAMLSCGVTLITIGALSWITWFIDPAPVDMGEINTKLVQAVVVLILFWICLLLVTDPGHAREMLFYWLGTAFVELWHLPRATPAGSRFDRLHRYGHYFPARITVALAACLLIYWVVARRKGQQPEQNTWPLVLPAILIVIAFKAWEGGVVAMGYLDVEPSVNFWVEWTVLLLIGWAICFASSRSILKHRLYLFVSFMAAAFITFWVPTLLFVFGNDAYQQQARLLEPPMFVAIAFAIWQGLAIRRFPPEQRAPRLLGLQSWLTALIIWHTWLWADFGR